MHIAHSLDSQQPDRHYEYKFPGETKRHLQNQDVATVQHAFKPATPRKEQPRTQLVTSKVTVRMARAIEEARRKAGLSRSEFIFNLLQNQLGAE